MGSLEDMPGAGTTLSERERGGKVHVVLVADGKYRMGLEATKASIVASAKHPGRLVVHELDETSLPPGALDAFGEYYGSKMPMVRMLLGEILPDEDWVVYADVDTLWFRDVEELWSECEDGFTFAWCRDIPSSQRDGSRFLKRIDPAYDDSDYCCSGVMLMNLKRMRESGVAGKAAAFVKAHGTPPYADQDVLNFIVPPSEYKFLDARWNVIRGVAGAYEKGAVYHLCGIGRQFGGEPRGRLPQFEMWWRFLAKIRGDRALAEKTRRAYPWHLRATWLLMGVLPLWRLPLPGASFFDRLRRALFFAWLRMRWK